MTRTVFVSNGEVKYTQYISVGPHLLRGDEPAHLGGGDAGPNPYELLLTALGACTGITLRMYADRKNWPLKRVDVTLSYERVHAEDSAASNGESVMVDAIEVELSLIGDLSQEQRERLMEVAERCPVHRTLTSPIQIRTRPVLFTPSQEIRPELKQQQS